MAKKASFLGFIFLPFFCFCQTDCFDENGDCTLVEPIEFEFQITVSCGDTVLLQPTQELCNVWSIPPDFNFHFGEGADSATVFLIAEQCFDTTIIVDGVTNTPSGGGIASCDTRFVYSFTSPMDTVQQELDCAAYNALESPVEVLQNSCGCDSLLIEYISLENADSTFLIAETCQPDEVGISEELHTASTGCDSIVIINTILYDPPPLVLADQHACIGDVISILAEAPTAVSYNWNTGEQTAFILTTDPGIYTVTITDGNGCTNTATAEASFSDIAIDLTATVADHLIIEHSPLEVWEGTAIQFDVQVYGSPFDYEVIWNRGPELGDSILNYIARESGEVLVAVFDAAGCVSSEIIELIVRPISVYVPSGFSPNGDGNNDQFDVYSSPNVEEVRLQVFSRSGSLIFDEYLLAEPDRKGLIWHGWNGRYNGRALNPQVFAYQVSYRAIQGEWVIISGDVSLAK